MFKAAACNDHVKFTRAVNVVTIDFKDIISYSVYYEELYIDWKKVNVNFQDVYIYYFYNIIIPDRKWNRVNRMKKIILIKK